MKKLLTLALAVLTAATVHAADEAPLFNALITMGGESRFILVSPAGATSEWIRIGDTFEGYTVKRFDPATSALEVEQGGTVTKLLLVADASVKSTPEAAGTKATLADAENVLQVMRFEDLMEKMLAQQKKQSVAMVQQMTSRMDAPGVDREELAAFQEKVMNEMMSVMNVAEMKKDMAQIYTDVFTKEELAAQSAFYTTPAGQALVDKTPEVQGRLQALMMPRVQAVMPKIMQMGQQFQAQQKAKAAAAAGAPNPVPAPAPGEVPKN